MRILFATFTYPPDANGIAETVAVHARGLAERGHAVTVATAHHARRAENLDGRVAIEPFALTGRADDSAAETQRYREFIATFPADVIVCHAWRFWATDLAIEAMPRNGARKVLISHGYTAHRWWPARRPFWGLGNFLRGLPYLAATPAKLDALDHLVVLSERRDFERFFDHWLIRWRGRPECSVIPNGTWPERFARHTGAEFRARHGIGDGSLLLCVATYAETKNQALALRAFLRAGVPGAALVFIGNAFNAYTDELRQSVPAAGPRVVFLEKLNRSEIDEAYVAADVITLTSFGETQPLVLLDAMGAGRPWVSTPAGCVPDLPGGLVAKSEASLAAAYRRLLTDPALRAEVAAAGVRAVEDTYSWQRVVEALESLLLRLCSFAPFPTR